MSEDTFSDEEAEFAKQDESLKTATSAENDDSDSAENSLDTETRNSEETAKDALSNEEALSEEASKEINEDVAEDKDALEAEKESVSIAHVSDDEKTDAEDDETTNGVEAIPKFDYLVRAEPKALKVFTGIFGVIFVLWLLIGIIAPFVLPEASAEANLPLLSEHHLLGTDGEGQDILLETLSASQVSFVLPLIPTLLPRLDVSKCSKL